MSTTQSNAPEYIYVENVNNRQGAIKHFGIPGDDPNKPETRSIALMPGVNKVAYADWVKLDIPTNVVLQHYKREGMIKLRGGKPAHELDPATAKKMISFTWNRELLLDWAQDETRPDVLKAIEAQMAEITAHRKAKAKAEGDAAEAAE